MRRTVLAASSVAAGRVRAVPPPSGSMVADWYGDADLADAYAVTLPGPGPHDLAWFAERALAAQPRWFGAAMHVRDAAVRPFGIRTSNEVRARLRHQGSDRIDFFPVLSRSAREIVLGEDDRHLDFRLSLRVSGEPSGRECFTATTVVRCHNRLGRAYLAAIRPGHILVVRSILRRVTNGARAIVPDA